MTHSLRMMSPRDRALLSLAGLSVGDGFGSRLLTRPEAIRSRTLPPAPWRWSDDTHMALSVVENLVAHGSIDQDALIEAFARRFRDEPRRGYGSGARRLLERVGTRPWRELARELFNGGSYGNGGAMRAGPLGAWLAGDEAEAAEQGRRQAEVTHAHPDGQAGGIAVSVAAAILASDDRVAGNELLRRVLEWVPKSETHAGLREAMKIPAGDTERAIKTLGTGREISSQDTVPFCLWVTAHRAGDFEDAMWTTIAGEEDGDTTCAIVGSLVALRSPPPAEWAESREALPSGFELEAGAR